jgi:crotonobetainyl-CoA:carnitine CoA-transferase CaiB-like acyl-CoA transferase
MALNLKDQRAQGIVHKLIGHYDILIEQFRPGVMAKLGLDYETLRQVNPALIYCSITGYGQTGPLALRAGHDINCLARSGIMSYSGRKGEAPVPSGVFIADSAAGTANAIIGILAALIDRNKTGRGQYVDISMTDGMIALNTVYAAACLIDGKSPDYESTVFNGGSLYDYYETKDGKYMSVGSLEPQFSSAFYEAIGRPDLIPGGISPPNIPDVKKQIRAIFKTKTREEWVEFFSRVDASVEPVLTVQEALENEQSKDRKIVVDIDLLQGGSVRQPALPMKFSTYQPEYKKIGVPAGFNTEEILRELGYNEEQIAEMEKTGLFN